MGGAVALVTTYDHGRTNVLPVVWHTPLSVRPPLVGIVIEQSRFSAEMISHSEQFAINIPARALLHHVQYLGSFSGARMDKLEATQFETFTATHVDPPLLTGCLAWIECAVQQALPMGDHVLYIGQVVAVHVDPEAFSDRWLIGPPDLRPLQFLGDHFYSTLEGVMEARMPGIGEAPERVLQDRIAEELELTREAQEKRDEALDEIRRDVDSGRVVNISELGTASAVPWTLPPGFVVPDLTPRE